jgi:hypothetical protein
MLTPFSGWLRPLIRRRASALGRGSQLRLVVFALAWLAQELTADRPDAEQFVELAARQRQESQVRFLKG